MVFLGRVSGLMERFEFDGRESVTTISPPPAVVGLFDPDDDGEAELFAGLPAPTVQDVLLQQATNDSVVPKIWLCDPGSRVRSAELKTRLSVVVRR